MNIVDAIKYFKFSNATEVAEDKTKPKKQKDNSASKTKFMRTANKAFNDAQLGSVLETFKKYTKDLKTTPRGLKFFRGDDKTERELMDYDLDTIARWYDVLPADGDEFIYLFHDEVLKNEKYRKALLEYLKSF